ncbi:hypothetical protein GOP47_0011985 [Adiantum capillus-veneris]|uniref:Uncharacterized protein n=1 Tax=Adiantum capillus-veneris TaxID=13818 RepID=A0A9D4ZHB0_ADICA|nr:hypothetical protein GOP47_0011985 [Adiantum capillus-veneris]
MGSHDVNVRSESMNWFSLEVVAEENSDPTPYEKLLGFVPSFQAVAGSESTESFMFVNHQPYVDDDMTEEDVWGQDDDMSSFDGSTTPSSKRWPDSESDSHFSASHDEGSIRRIRFAGIFSPSQFSPITMDDWEAMRGRPFHSFHTMAPEYGAAGTIKSTRHVVGASPHHGMLLFKEGFSPSDGPRSAPIEVPLWSRLCSQMGDEDDDGDDDDMNNAKRVPPHELLAKQLARSRISAFSVIEGAGRTLKGRDASEVRDAVWKQTGFPG